MTKDMNLGRLLGQREAFSVVAGRCTAADAALLYKIKQEKLYLDYAADWKEFCENYLHMSDDSAGRLIKPYGEFGQNYYLIAQLTRISPATYRLLEPSIDEQGLHYNGETIAFVPENAVRLTAAVAELRKEATLKALPAPAETPVAPEPSAIETIEALDLACLELSAKIEKTIPLVQAERFRMKVTVCRLRDRLNLLELKI
jgi:hypothetical protein